MTHTTSKKLAYASEFATPRFMGSYMWCYAIAMMFRSPCTTTKGRVGRRSSLADVS